MTVLTGHTSPESAYLVPDYPYGFRLRCQIRYWIETTKRGQRVVSQTTNPKRPGTAWNLPKASTYTNLRVLFIDDTTGHVENDALSFYGDAAKIAEFEAKYAAALTSERDQKELALLKAIAKQQEEQAARRTASATTAQFVAGLVVAASLAFGSGLAVASAETCGLVPLKPIPPLGCKDLVPQCVVDEHGHARWTWICVPSR